MLPVEMVGSDYFCFLGTHSSKTGYKVKFAGFRNSGSHHRINYFAMIMFVWLETVDIKRLSKMCVE